jgi:hypothetical protein
MNFGARGNYTTASQTLLVSNSGSGVLGWNASDNRSWMSVSPSSGTNSGEVTVTVNKSGLSAGTYTGTITISGNATNSPKTVPVTFRVYNSSSKPFGLFATPTHGTTVRSSIPVTGWVLDDIGIESVKIYNGNTYVGDATFVDGARPDVAAAYPDYPQNYQAGWGYMMLTYFLPGGGNGTYTFYAKARDKEGNEVTLGSKTVTIDNNGAVKPFGAIDTPAQGGTASGSSYLNWGWALTPQPNKIPTDGSTIDVWVNGVNKGHPSYNLYRSDIATLFPSYANKDGAVGLYYMDTTALDNGVYTIQWTAKDNADNSDGIGSRYFSIKNTGSDAAQQYNRKYRKNNRITYGNSLYKADQSMISSSMAVADQTAPVWVRKGYDLKAEPVPVYPDEDGRLVIEIDVMERLEIHFFPPAPNFNLENPYSQLKRHPEDKIKKMTFHLSHLPVGSALDHDNGIFYWQVGMAYMGEFPLSFMNAVDNGWTRRDITVRIVPQSKQDQ